MQYSRTPITRNFLFFSWMDYVLYKVRFSFTNSSKCVGFILKHPIQLPNYAALLYSYGPIILELPV